MSSHESPHDSDVTESEFWAKWAHGIASPSYQKQKPVYRTRAWQDMFLLHDQFVTFPSSESYMNVKRQVNLSPPSPVMVQVAVSHLCCCSEIHRLSYSTPHVWLLSPVTVSTGANGCPEFDIWGAVLMWLLWWPCRTIYNVTNIKYLYGSVGTSQTEKDNPTNRPGILMPGNIQWTRSNLWTFPGGPRAVPHPSLGVFWECPQNYCYWVFQTLAKCVTWGTIWPIQLWSYSLWHTNRTVPVM